ncbi:MAG: hypothetical protein CRN43_11530 [Candidatus Nephrothrix sp. EaCA]|nr:MAG: hypothetical protein CRN43_11530 [Candidatus Nephrothrix sp. EaCA]
MTPRKGASLLNFLVWRIQDTNATFYICLFIDQMPLHWGFWARWRRGIHHIQQEVRGTYLLSCGKKYYIGKRLFLPLLKVAFIT